MEHSKPLVNSFVILGGLDAHPTNYGPVLFPRDASRDVEKLTVTFVEVTEGCGSLHFSRCRYRRQMFPLLIKWTLESVLWIRVPLGLFSHEEDLSSNYVSYILATARWGAGEVQGRRETSLWIPNGYFRNYFSKINTIHKQNNRSANNIPWATHWKTKSGKFLIKYFKYRCFSMK